MIANVVAIVALLAVAAVTLSPRLRRLEAWRATVTPLASIIGSGFLVSLPLLARELGVYAPAAMAGLLVFAHLLGGAMRFNIAHGEKLFDGEGFVQLTRFDALSRLALAFAYFISVTYYLSLLAAFMLKGVNLENDTLLARIICSGLLAALGGWGCFRGLRGLEAIEEYAVGLKLAVIAAVLGSLMFFNINLALAGDWRVLAPAVHLDWRHLQLVLGLLIVVQGFETSRFLKDAYPRRLRIQSMRWAQAIAALIYFAFFSLSLPILHTAPATPDVAGVTNMLQPIASALPLMLIAGAVFAQLSAAIADAIGAAGLIHETSQGKFAEKWAYPIIAAVGLALVWSFDVFRVIQLASSAFALFYAMQTAAAALVAMGAPGVRWRWARAAGFALLALAALGAALFGVPAEAGG